MSRNHGRFVLLALALPMLTGCPTETSSIKADPGPLVVRLSGSINVDGAIQVVVEGEGIDSARSPLLRGFWGVAAANKANGILFGSISNGNLGTVYVRDRNKQFTARVIGATSRPSYLPRDVTSYRLDALKAPSP